MIPIYPDLAWYSDISERKALPTRCPHATVRRCPRYFESVSLLGEVGIATKLPESLDAQLSSMWKKHDLWPVTQETATSISGGHTPNCFSNFCPEVAYDTFKLFASSVISFYDEIDRNSRANSLDLEGTTFKNDWRRDWQHVSPLHYSDCALFSKIPKEQLMPHVTIHGNVHGQVNIAGESVNLASLDISIGEILSQIEASSVSPEEKAAAKSRLQQFLEHPVVAAIVGGLASRIGA